MVKILHCEDFIYRVIKTTNSQRNITTICNTQQIVLHKRNKTKATTAAQQRIMMKEKKKQ